MKNIILFFIAMGPVACLPAQQKLVPRITTITHKLGDDHARIKIFKYGSRKDIVFINLHADETTSIAEAQKLLQQRGGILVKLENNNQRNIRFKLKGSLYTFDPNRIFSKQGIAKTLAGFKNVNDLAVREVEKFASKILDLLPEETRCFIALHNNTDGNLSINSFLAGNEYARDAKKVYANEKQDPDDFFLTTDSLLFEQLSAEKYNTILQDNLNVQQDGSLSVYFGEKNICYLNCETEHGKAKQYEEMINAALRYAGSKK